MELTKSDIRKYNEFIAKFMGGKVALEFSHTPVVRFPNGRVCLVRNLKYHSSWDRLMEVVEKIKGASHMFPVTASLVTELMVTTPIDEVYLSVVSVIGVFNSYYAADTAAF